MRSIERSCVCVAFLAVFLAGCRTTGEGESPLEQIFGDTEGMPPRARFFPETWGGWADLKAEYVLESDSDEKDELDNSVSTMISQLGVRLDGPTGWPGGWLITFVNYVHVDYDWDDDPDPFDDARFLSANVWMVQGLSQEWAVALLLNGGWNTESGASFGEGFNWWAATGAIHRFSEDLAIGAGLFVSRTINEEWSVFPGINGFWNFAEDWSLWLIGPRLETRYEHSPRLTFFAAAEIDSGHWLLDEQRDGRDDVVARDFRMPITAGVEWGITDRLELRAQVGFDAVRTITWDEDGDDEERIDFDPSMSLAATVIWWF